MAEHGGLAAGEEQRSTGGQFTDRYSNEYKVKYSLGTDTLY